MDSNVVKSVDKLFFIGLRYVWFTFSLSLIILGIVFMFRNFSEHGTPFNLGIDFTGGTSMVLDIKSSSSQINAKGELKTPFRANVITDIDNILKINGITHMQVSTVDKRFFSIKTSVITKEKLDSIINQLKEKLGEITVLESAFIGPTIGYELQKQAFSITMVALFLLLIYITFRFEFWAAVSAIIALIHDSLITIGLASLLHLEVDAAFVAAILTILGYSINDTIVIFDRIRENNKLMKDDFAKIAETSIWQTLTRSIYTVLTVLFVLLVLLIFGGVSLHDFTLTLLIGIFFGCYSSIFIASPLLVMFKKLS